ncbi:MAG: sigma factor G inhibitor Gin [Eubacteriales bacterium]
MNDKPAMCYFCGRNIAAGAERLVLLKHLMCSCCEKQLVNISANDDLYMVFKEKIKKIWFK